MWKDTARIDGPRTVDQKRLHSGLVQRGQARSRAGLSGIVIPRPARAQAAPFAPPSQPRRCSHPGIIASGSEPAAAVTLPISAAGVRCRW